MCRVNYRHSRIEMFRDISPVAAPAPAVTTATIHPYRAIRAPVGGAILENVTGASEDFFADLARRGHEQALEKVRGVCRFDVRDDGGSTHWLVQVDRGDIAVSRGHCAADCVVAVDRALFDRIAGGEASALTALLRGALIVEGELDLLVLLERLVRARLHD